MASKVDNNLDLFCQVYQKLIEEFEIIENVKENLAIEEEAIQKKIINEQRFQVYLVGLFYKLS